MNRRPRRIIHHGIASIRRRTEINRGAATHGFVCECFLRVSKFEVTFANWDACATHGTCDPQVSDGGFGRGQQPLVNVTWRDASRYVAWLSAITRRPYRLLSEAEYEYAARAGTTSVYPWGDSIGVGNT